MSVHLRSNTSAKGWFLTIFVIVAAPACGSQSTDNRNQQIQQQITECRNVCDTLQVGSPSSEQLDRCGVAAVGVVSKIAEKGTNYVSSARRYRIIGGVLLLLASTFALIILSRLLSRRRQYARLRLALVAVTIAALGATLVIVLEPIVTAGATRDLIGADRDLRILTALQLLPQSAKPCFLADFVAKYGKERQESETAKALATYVGALKSFGSVEPNADNKQSAIEDRANDLIEFLSPNAQLDPGRAPSSASAVLADDNYLQFVADRRLGLLRSRWLLALGLFIGSLALAWLYEWVRARRRQHAHVEAMAAYDRVPGATSGP